MPKKPSDYKAGLETILNNSKASPLKNPQVFYEVQKQSQMTLSQMLKAVGKTAKGRKGGAQKEPTDAEKSEQRLLAMKSATEKSVE